MWGGMTCEIPEDCASRVGVRAGATDTSKPQIVHLIAYLMGEDTVADVLSRINRNVAVYHSNARGSFRSNPRPVKTKQNPMCM